MLRKNKQLSKELQRIRDDATVPREPAKQWENLTEYSDEDGASPCRKSRPRGQLTGIHSTRGESDPSWRGLKCNHYLLLSSLSHTPTQYRTCPILPLGCASTVIPARLPHTPASFSVRNRVFIPFTLEGSPLFGIIFGHMSNGKGEGRLGGRHISIRQWDGDGGHSSRRALSYE